MSRFLTTYRRPSISDLIRTAPSVEALAQLRDSLGDAFARGQVAAQERTIRDWREAIYMRLTELMMAATTAEDLSYIFNASFKWYNDDQIRAALEAFVQHRAAALPNRTEVLRAAGIEIQGRAA